MEISWADADADREFAEIVTAAASTKIRAPLFPAYEERLREGWVMVEDQLAFASDADSRRRYFARGTNEEPWGEELRENEIHIDSGMDFSNFTWRFAVLNTALDVVRKLLPEAAAISPGPFRRSCISTRRWTRSTMTTARRPSVVRSSCFFDLASRVTSGWVCTV